MAAHRLMGGATHGEVTAVAEDYIQSNSGLGDAVVTVTIPPATGPYAGNTSYVELVVEVPTPTYLSHLFAGDAGSSVQARAVSGYGPATAPVVVGPLSTESRVQRRSTRFPGSLPRLRPSAWGASNSSAWGTSSPRGP